LGRSWRNTSESNEEGDGKWVGAGNQTEKTNLVFQLSRSLKSHDRFGSALFVRVKVISMNNMKGNGFFLVNKLLLGLRLQENHGESIGKTKKRKEEEPKQIEKRLQRANQQTNQFTSCGNRKRLPSS
jgi:hypothetical protein